MANHAYAKTGKTLDPQEVGEHIKRLVKEKLGDLFNVEYNPDGEYMWVVSCKKDDKIAFAFWISDDYEYSNPDISYPNPGWDKKTVLSKNSVLEFRHGHGFNFMWWVEGVIRENLGKIYNANMFDDGCEIDPKPSPEIYETFETFCSRRGKPKEQKKHWFPEYERKETPKELIEGLKLDFKV